MANLQLLAGREHIMKRNGLWHVAWQSLVTTSAVLCVIVTLTLSAAAASKYTTLYKFKGGKDGSSPSGLIFDAAGNLYGTTSGGGTYGAGTVFKLDKAGSKSVLYNFTGGNDGANPHPYSHLVFDAAGNLYGTTYAGGVMSRGTVFKLDTRGIETVLYNFCAGFLFPCPDGAYPAAAVLLDPAGKLYGTASLGGDDYVGVLFELTQATDGSWSETVLHSFDIDDGNRPYSNVVRDSGQNLYGVTEAGGPGHWGSIYKLDPSGAEVALYSFTGGADGSYPDGAPVRDATGNLFGSAPYGGNPSCPGPFGTGCGTIFQLDVTGKLHVLYTFSGGSDGSSPVGGVIRDQTGSLYGTTVGGGAYGYGLVFKLTPSSQGWTEHVLHAFADRPGADPGAYPVVNLTLDASGNLYGTTQGDGTTTFGSIFEITR
jgi:uncharacterized repeat protein (TIGR03803 family)